MLLVSYENEQKCDQQLRTNLNRVTSEKYKINKSTISPLESSNPPFGCSDLSNYPRPLPPGELTYIPLYNIVVYLGGQADIFGLILGDELMSINSTNTNTLSLEGVHSLLSQESVRIQFRTKRRKLPYSAEEIELINTLICPAPPMSTSRLSTQEIGPLVIPNPKHLSFMSIRDLADRDEPPEEWSDQDLLQTLVNESQALNYSVRFSDFFSPLEEESTQPPLPSKGSRLIQCCNELVCTEKEFISALGLLLQRYYSIISLVGTPGDRQNAFILPGIRINQYHLY